jgi:hypothetical protein
MLNLPVSFCNDATALNMVDLTSNNFCKFSKGKGKDIPVPGRGGP